MNNFDAEKALALLLDRGQESSSKIPPSTLQIEPVIKVSFYDFNFSLVFIKKSDIKHHCKGHSLDSTTFFSKSGCV